MLLTEFDVMPGTGRESAGTFEVGSRQDQKTPQLVLIEIPYRVDEVPIEGHDASGNLEWGKQPSSSPTIGQRPPKGWRHSIRVLTAHEITRSRRHPVPNVVQPDGPFAIVVRHY